MSNLLINEPLSRSHIGSSTICSQEEGSQYGVFPVVLISRKGSLVHKDCNSYSVNGEEFSLVGRTYTYKDLSIELPIRTAYTTFERLLLGLGYQVYGEDTVADLDITSRSMNFRKVLHILTMMALKDMSLIYGTFSLHKQLRYGEHVFESYLKAVTGKGTIKAKNKHIRWLNEVDTLQLKATLFSTSGYQVGVNSMEYTHSLIAETLFTKVFEFLDVISFQENIIEPEPLDFTVTVVQLKKIRLRDTMLILSKCIGFNGSSFIIRQELKDRQNSRVYSLFTSISSDTRQLLGFTNYDIGSALQTICLQLTDNPNIYPLHQELSVNKITFRTKVMHETGENIAWVKKELSKADNLDIQPKRYNRYPTLKAYFAESLVLRKEIIQGADEEVYSIAYGHAKYKWTKIWSTKENNYEYVVDGKKESSIFFFIWTQFEREIREAMMSCFSSPESCHQVHDAVYSTENIATAILQEHILDSTGFKLLISND